MKRMIVRVAAGLPHMPSGLPPIMDPEVKTQFNTIYQRDDSLDDVLQVRDILLYEALKEAYEVVYENPLALLSEITSSIVPKEVFASPLRPFWDLCFLLMPKYLSAKWGYTYTEEIAKPLLTREAYIGSVEEARDCILALGLKEGRVVTAFKILRKFTNTNFLDSLTTLFLALKPKIRPKLDTNAERQIFLRFFKLYTEEVPDESALEDIYSVAKRLPDMRLRRYIKSIQIPQDALEHKFLTGRQNVEDVALRLFGTASPDFAQIEKVAEKSPDKYKAWRKQVSEINRMGKTLLKEAWDRENLPDVIEAKVARKLCTDIGIKCPIDDAFIGKVSLGPTPGVMFSYYTKWGKALESTLGPGVTMNPKYTKEDDTYYCTSRPPTGVSTKVYRAYTTDYRSKRTGIHFQRAANIVECVEDVRNTARKDIKVNNWNTKSLSALVVRLLDLTAGRIGNRGSEAEDSYGIHNLKLKHIKIKELGKQKTVVISYPGKKGVAQRHLVTDRVALSSIENLMKGRKPKDYVFSVDGKTPISVVSVTKYLKDIGFPGTPHSWRKYHAATTFTEAVREGYKDHELKTKKSKKPKPPDAMGIFKGAVGAVAERLGNTPNVAIRSYIDSSLMMAFFEKEGIEPPANVKKAFEMRKEKESEDD